MSWKRTTVNRVSILLTLSFYSKRTDFWSLIPSVTSMMYHVCRCQRFQFPALSVQFKVLPFDMLNLFVFEIYCVCHLVRVSCIALSTCPSRSRDTTLKSDLSSALLVWITSHWVDVATWACDAIFRTFGRVFLLSAAVSSTSFSVFFFCHPFQKSVAGDEMVELESTRIVVIWTLFMASCLEMLMLKTESHSPYDI